MIAFARYNRAFCCDLFDNEYKKGHCCEAMVDYLHDPYIPIKYEETIRRYYIESQESISRIITFCPGCGKNLPEILHDKYFEALKNEYGFEGGIDDYEKFPEEFKSDEWWKKRKL